MKKYFKKNIEDLKKYTYLDWVQTIGGIFVFLYLPLFIILIWDFNFITLKLIFTNSLIILLIKFLDKSSD